MLLSIDEILATALQPLQNIDHDNKLAVAHLYFVNTVPRGKSRKKYQVLYTTRLCFLLILAEYRTGTPHVVRGAAAKNRILRSYFNSARFMLSIDSALGDVLQPLPHINHDNKLLLPTGI